MSALLYRVINPLVVGVLRSPLHPLLSGNTVVVYYRGRRSGRALHTPVSYHQHNGELHCFAGRSHRWWCNLEGGPQVSVLLRGRRMEAVAEVIRDAPAVLLPRLRDFLRAVPRDAAHAGVRLENGEPASADLAAAAPALVHVVLRPLPAFRPAAAADAAVDRGPPAT